MVDYLSGPVPGRKACPAALVDALTLGGFFDLVDSLTLSCRCSCLVVRRGSRRWGSPATHARHCGGTLRDPDTAGPP